MPPTNHCPDCGADPLPLSYNDRECGNLLFKCGTNRLSGKWNVKCNRLDIPEWMAEASRLIADYHVKFGNVHSSSCAMVVSAKKRSGRVESCSCALEERQTLALKLIQSYGNH